MNGIMYVGVANLVPLQKHSLKSKIVYFIKVFDLQVKKD